MKIYIFVENEDIAELKPLALRLSKRGSQVNFRALRYRDPSGHPDMILTLPRYKDIVTELFQGRGIPIRLIEDEEADSSETQAASGTPPVLIVAEPEEIIDVQLSPPAETDEEVVMTVGEISRPVKSAVTEEIILVTNNPISRASRSRRKS